MRKIYLALMIILFTVSLAFASEKKAQTYNVIITVEYKDIDLKMIAEKEAQIKKLFGDAYQVKIDFKSECQSKEPTYWIHGNPENLKFTPN